MANRCLCTVMAIRYVTGFLSATTVELFVSVLKHGRLGEVYNVGGDSEMNNKDVVHAICNTVDELKPKLPHSPSTSLITYVVDRPGHDRRYAIDFRKIQRELNWQPTLNFAGRYHPDGSLVFGASRVGGKCSRWRIPKHSPRNSP